MKRAKISRKRIIEKRIELRNSGPGFINKKGVQYKKKMDDLDSIRNRKPTGTNHTRDELRLIERTGVDISKPKINFVDFGVYKKKVRVDYDVVFCVSSYDRYDKIRKILEQVFSQKTKYTFKFILMNDGSTDKRYDELKYLFPDIVYLKNEIGGGKINYWRTINTLWSKAKEFNTYAVIQLDDDFILCKNFLNILLDTFFQTKSQSNDYMIFNYHLYNFDKDKPLEDWWYDEKEIFVDGGMLIDVQFLEKMNYALDNIEKRVTIKSSSYTWVRLKERLIEFGAKVYRFKHSLVWHDGNDDSKLHPNIRSKKRVYTKNFIDKNITSYEQ